MQRALDAARFTWSEVSCEAASVVAAAAVRSRLRQRQRSRSRARQVPQGRGRQSSARLLAPSTNHFGSWPVTIQLRGIVNAGRAQSRCGFRALCSLIDTRTAVGNRADGVRPGTAASVRIERLDRWTGQQSSHPANASRAISPGVMFSRATRHPWGTSEVRFRPSKSRSIQGDWGVPWHGAGSLGFAGGRRADDAKMRCGLRQRQGKRRTGPPDRRGLLRAVFRTPRRSPSLPRRANLSPTVPCPARG